jgi:copper chaperone CopZ
MKIFIILFLTMVVMIGIMTMIFSSKNSCPDNCVNEVTNALDIVKARSSIAFTDATTKAIDEIQTYESKIDHKNEKSV